MGEVYAFGLLALPLLLLSVAVVVSRYLNSRSARWLGGLALFAVLTVLSIPVIMWLWDGMCSYEADQCV